MHIWPFKHFPHYFLGLKSHFRILGIGPLIAVTIGLLGCADNPFSTHKKEAGIWNTPSYRKVNEACTGVDLSSPILNNDSFLKVLDCFNTYGALEPLVDLVKSLSSEQLKSVVDGLNQYILKDPALLYEIETTYTNLKEKGLLKEVLTDLSELLKNEEFIRAGLLVAQDLMIKNEGNTQADIKFLRGIELFTQGFSDEELMLVSESTIRFLESPAARELKKRFRNQSQSGRSTRDLIYGLLEYIKTFSSEKKNLLFIEIKALLESGKFYGLIDQIFGLDSTAIKAKVPTIASVANFVFDSKRDQSGSVINAPIFVGLSELFAELNGPVYCFNRTQWIPNVDGYVIKELLARDVSEIPRWLRKDNPLLLSSLSPVCDLPEVIGKNYPSLIELSDTPALAPSIELLRLLDSNQMMDLLYKLFSSKKEKGDANIEKILPLLSELTERGAWEDLLFLGTSFNQDERKDFKKFVKLVSKEQPTFGGQSLADVFLESLNRVKPEHLVALVEALKPWINEDDENLSKILRMLRSVYYVNSARPLIKIAHSVINDVSKNTEILKLFFEVSSKKKFRNTVVLFSELASNGKLDELATSLISIFHRFAIQGQHTIVSYNTPELVNNSIHTLSSRDIIQINRKNFDAVKNQFDFKRESDPCSQLDPRAPWLDKKGRLSSDGQFDKMLGCLGSDSNFVSQIRSIDFLRKSKLKSGKSVFDFTIESLLDLNVSSEFISSFLNTSYDWFDSGKWNEASELVTSAILKSVDAGDRRQLSLVQSALNWITEVLFEMGPSMRRGLKFLEAPLQDDRFFELGSTLYQWSKEKIEPEAAARWQKSYDWNRMDRWLQNRECLVDPRQKRTRIQEIISDYENAPNSWESPRLRSSNSEWTKKKLHEELNPLIEKLYDSSQSATDKSPLQALLNVIGYFTLPSDQSRGILSGSSGPNHSMATQGKHYSPEYLGRFLSERSTDFKLIWYFYPGEKVPQVRLVNTLDRFELLLINADFSYLDFISPGNFGLKFMALVSQAWGDDPYWVWPSEIKKKYGQQASRCHLIRNEDERKRAIQEGRCPPRLREAYNEILDTLNLAKNALGFPEIPNQGSCEKPVADPNDPIDIQRAETEKVGSTLWGGLHPLDVKANTFNLVQVVNVIEENLPDHQGRNAGGLKVLRDLVYEIYTSSPPNSREATSGWKNNLNIVTKLVKMGFLRKVSTLMSSFPPLAVRPEGLSSGNARLRQSDLYEFFRVFVESANHKSIPEILRLLFERNEGRELFWSIVDQVFDVLDAANGRISSPGRLREVQGLSASERAQAFKNWKLESDRMSQLLFYLIVEGGKMGIVDPILRATNDILKEDLKFVQSESARFEGILRSKELSYFVRAVSLSEQSAEKKYLVSLVQEWVSDSDRVLDILKWAKWMSAQLRSESSFQVFKRRLDLFTKSQGYVAFSGRLERESTLSLGFPELINLLKENRQIIGTQLKSKKRERIGGSGYESSNIEEWLDWLETNPHGMYELMRALAESLELGQWDALLGLARRSMLPLSVR